MIKKKTIFIITLLLSLCAISACADDVSFKLDSLVAQVKGQDCSYQISKGELVKSNPFNFLIRRSNQEQCIIDAAQALGAMGSQARDAVPVLIEALDKYHNIDSGDGIIPVRSEIAFALGRIGDTRAIEPLLNVLNSDDQAVLSESASVPPSYKLKSGTSYEAVIEAVGMFGSKAKQALPILNNLLSKGQDKYLEFTIKDTIKKINQ